MSETKNENILQRKEATHDSRLERDCRKIDIGTRWTVNDVIGKNTTDNNYDLQVIISALDENNESFCEDVKTTEQYHEIKKKINDDIWSAEYQQEPVDLKGRLFAGLKIIPLNDFEEFKTKFEGFIGYIDVSDQGKDFTALAIAGIIGQEVFIVDYVFSRENTDVTIPICAEKLNRWGVFYCRVESNSMGAMFSRNLAKLVKTKILQVHNTQNKMTRIIMQSATIINSFNFIDNETKEFNQFIENVKKFTKDGSNKNDDAPDCLAGLSMFIKSMFKKLNI